MFIQRRSADGQESARWCLPRASIQCSSCPQECLRQSNPWIKSSRGFGQFMEHSGLFEISLCCLSKFPDTSRNPRTASNNLTLENARNTFPRLYKEANPPQLNNSNCNQVSLGSYPRIVPRKYSSLEALATLHLVSAPSCTKPCRRTLGEFTHRRSTP